MRVLVVEDHAKLAMTLATGLRQAGMAVDVVFDGHDALAHLAVTAYDVVVLDRDIPGVHGDDVCKAIVAQGSPSRETTKGRCRTLRPVRRCRRARLQPGWPDGTEPLPALGLLLSESMPTARRVVGWLEGS